MTHTETIHKQMDRLRRQRDAGQSLTNSGEVDNAQYLYWLDTTQRIVDEIFNKESDQSKYFKLGRGNAKTNIQAISNRIEFLNTYIDILDHSLSLMRDLKRVFVVHGRNSAARDAMFLFLRSLGLQPIGWEQAVALAGRGGTPTTLDIVRAGMDAAGVVVVLITPDEHVELVEELASSTGDRDAGHQPRPNVLLEAGMTLALSAERTVLVSIGSVRRISDIDGINYVQVSNDPGTRHNLALRLLTAGSQADLTGEYQDIRVAGDFEAARLR